MWYRIQSTGNQVVAAITTLVPIVQTFCAPFLVKLDYQEKSDDRSEVVQYMLGGLLIIFFGGTNVPVLLVGAVIAAAGYGLKASMHFAMQPDPVDYGEWKSGVNTAGTLSAVNGFIGKVGYGNCQQYWTRHFSSSVDLMQIWQYRQPLHSSYITSNVHPGYRL
ncbi:MAG: MFS transporter [Dorea formicigenerans]